MSQLDRWVVSGKKVDDARNKIEREREDIRKILQGEKEIEGLDKEDMHYLDGRQEGLEWVLDLLSEAENYDNPEDNS